MDTFKVLQLRLFSDKRQQEYRLDELVVVFGSKLRSEFNDGSVKIVLFYEVGVVKVVADISIHKGLKNVKSRKGIGKIFFGDFVVYHKVSKQKERHSDALLSCGIKSLFYSKEESLYEFFCLNRSELSSLLFLLGYFFLLLFTRLIYILIFSQFAFLNRHAHLCQQLHGKFSWQTIKKYCFLIIDIVTRKLNKHFNFHVIIIY